ncbi:Pheromone receptor [Mycena chlorophos]|uniref:Pheromone receptor n=1 Tax=Mycena chlorophos TaxID=658473 RepID=A0A8H6TNJ7_MYCCL|nr:Pheromone receptor [Mycena chlorophos]
MFDPTPLFSACSFLGFVMVLIPLPWHLHAWNSGTCFYIMWSALACLNQFVNSVVWANDVLNKAPVWCDISIRITMAVSVGLPAASLCINRRLYQISKVESVSITPREVSYSILIPSAGLRLWTLSSASPFRSFTCLFSTSSKAIATTSLRQIGPQTALVNMLPVYFITLMWPPLIGCISACYGVLSLRSFFRRRAAFSQFLSPNASHASGLTTARYLRLMALAAVDILITTPLGIFAIYLNATATPFGPWRSWADTHFDYSRVEQYPAFIWRADLLLATGLESTRWAAPLSAVLFFLFFGFAAEARKNYMVAIRSSVSFFWRCLARVGIQRPTRGFFALASTTKSPSSKGRPSFVTSSPIKPKLPPIRHSALSISLPLPLYSTGSLTEVAGSSASPSSTEFTDLKRAPSYASGSTRATYGYIYDGAGSPDVDGSRCDSRFVEHLGEVYDLEKGVPPEDEKFEEPSRRDEHPSYYMDVHGSRPAADAIEIDTPSTATSFPPSSPSAAGHDSAPVTPNFALPLHLGWATRPYPAVYAGAQTTASSLVEPARERERQSWSPAPSPSSESFAMESMRERERPASTGSAETTGGRGRSRTLV